MLIAVFFYAAVISFPTAFSESGKVFRTKRSDDYVPCERGWYYFRDKCYKIFARKTSERLSWSRALERCRQYGGDLVSIQSQEEQDFVVSFLQLDVKSWVWIGLNDRDKESDYKWTDGSAFNYTNWKPREPSGKGGGGEEEDCIHMVFEPERDIIGKWNDRNCDIPETYACEKPPRILSLDQDANLVLPLSYFPEDAAEDDYRKRSPNQLFCSSEAGGGWKYQSSCYHVVKEANTWEDAEKHCKYNYNGHLVDILGTLEDFFLDYIVENLREELWIGIKTKDQLQQKWTSGWFVSYDGFNKDQLNFKDGTCVARKKRKEWTIFPCTKKLPFICEVSKETPPVLKPPARPSHCPVEFDEWRDLGGEYCYYFEKEKALNFYEALFDCKRRGGSLVSLHSKEESDMLLPFVRYAGKFFFIGLFRLLGREEEFAWTDGSEVDYENWKVNEPNNLDEKCVEALTHDDPNGIIFTWNDNRCETKRGYICSVKKVPQSSNLEEDEGCTSCVSLKVLIGVSVVCILLVIILVGVVVYYFRPCSYRKNSAAATMASTSPSTNLPPYRSTTELVVKDDETMHYEMMP